MEYNDELMPSAEIMSKMAKELDKSINIESTQVEICEMTELRQKAELEELFRLLSMCESFFKWIEGDKDQLKEMIDTTKSDIVTIEGCCNRYGLDYRYACEEDFHPCKDFDKDCKKYCKCEFEILDKIIKLLSLKNSIIDKQCMFRLMKNRMDIFRTFFDRYCR